MAVYDTLSLIRKAISLPASNSTHIREGINWLLRAQDMTPDKGVSEGFHIFRGWLASYPETTGYIIETFLDYYQYSKEKEIKERALQMADWLISIQYDDGAFPDSYFKNMMVFDTGQILFGLVRTYEETGEHQYKEAAIRAGEWLVAEQEDDGSWIKNAYNKIPHTYYTRVAWGLLTLHRVTKDEKYVRACRKNIEWALSNQYNNGWFNKASFSLQNHDKPFTHTIAYTIRGILESGIYLNEKKYIASAVLSLENLLSEIDVNGFVCGSFNKNWEGTKRFACLTGSAQLAIMMFKLAKLNAEEKFLKKGSEINRYLKEKQNIRTDNLNIRGGIAGSCPIWGQYLHFNYPNWAVKFFVDSLLLESEFCD